MQLRYARKLHHRDQVTLKATKETGYVVKVCEPIVLGGRTLLCFQLQMPSTGFCTATHLEIQ